MTTSGPQADRRDDDAGGEHRTIGQRIRDAVLGEEPAGTRRDAPEGAGGYADPDRAERGYADTDREAAYADRPGETYTDEARGTTGGVGQGVGDAPPSGGAASSLDDPGRRVAPSEYGAADTVRADTVRDDRGWDTPRDEAPQYDTPQYDTGRDDPVRDRDDRWTDSGSAPVGGAVPDPVVDDVAQDGRPRTADAGYADPGRSDAAYADPGRSDSGYADPGRSDTGYADPGRSDAGYADPASAGDVPAAPQDRDLVTSSYDPDRDGGYDPQAAGTAMTEPRGTGDYDTRDYDPAADAAYVDTRRADVDRTTGDRDDDYDTGRVDRGEVPPVGTDPAASETHHAGGAGTVGAVAAGGATAAGAVAAAHHRDDARDDDRADDRDARFSDADDTSTVDASSTGRATADPATGTAGTPDAGWNAPTATAAVEDDAVDQRAEAVAADDESEAEGGRERLVPADRADNYSSRWDALKGDFVDEPRRAVAQADDLVGELLDEIQRLFADQRRDLEQGFDHDRASTEDLRLALRRYRSFFDRLLSF